MISLLNNFYNNEYNKVAKHQNSKYGNQITKSEHSQTIATYMDRWIKMHFLTAPDAKKIINKLAKAAYGEWGLIPGTIGGALGQHERNIPFHERGRLEADVM